MLKRMFPVLMAVVTAAAIVIACGEKEDKKDTPANAAGVEAAGKLSLNQPSQIFTKAGEALASANITGQGGTSLRLADQISTQDELCSQYGDPWDKAANDKMRSDADGYAARVFYCLVNSKVDKTVETIPGFFKQQSSIICTLEENLEINVDQFTEAGHEYIPQASKTLTFSEKCWPQGKPDGQSGIVFSSGVGKKLAESTGWQYQFALTGPQFSFTMRYFKKDGVIGMSRFKSAENTGGTGEGMTAVMDTNKGVMLFESFDDGNKDSSNPFRRVNRVRVKGTFDENLKFKEITEGRGLAYESGPGFAAETGNQHQFWLYTVDGAKDRGYQFKSFSNTEAAKTTVTNTKTECNDGNCQGASELGTIDEMKGLAFRNQATTTAWTNFIDRKPVCEPAENGAAAISYSALIPNTGAFGKCD